jgi:predicted dehydrogenase
VRSGKVGRIWKVEVGFGFSPKCQFEPNVPPPADLDWNMWLGPVPWTPYNPQRCIYNFRWFWDYSGGKMTDWGAHHLDITQWGLGMDGSGPIAVKGQMICAPDSMYETPTWHRLEYTYEVGGKKIPVICGGEARDGIKFFGDKGWVHVNRGFLKTFPDDLVNEKIGPGDVHLFQSPGHRENFMDCVISRERPLCDVEIGYRSVSVCHIGNIALRTGRELRWDPQAEQFIGDEDANRWLNKPMRAPWHL